MQNAQVSPIAGGSVPPELVVGRDGLIDRIWSALETRSAVLVSERRIGKTSIIRKMEAEPREGWTAFYMALEGVRTPLEFIGRLVDKAGPVLSRKNRALVVFERVYEELAGQKLKDWTLPVLHKHWKRLLRTVLDDLAENFGDRVVFLWDELPFMIANIAADVGPKAAMELLDVLRERRLSDTRGRVRMLYTGSVGLHLVLGDLKRAGYLGDPTNDMATFTVGSLSENHGVELASRGLTALVETGELRVGPGVSIDELALATTRATDGLPFHLDHVVLRLVELEQPVTIGRVDEAVESLVMDPNDPAHFRHYDERIDVYYDFHELARPLAVEVLGYASRADGWVSESELWKDVTAHVELNDRRLFQQLMEALLADHYVTRELREGERHYRFRYGLIQRWWRDNRA